MAAQAWLWKDHTGAAEAAAITQAARHYAPQYLAPIGGVYSSEWFWSKIWRCLEVDPEVFTAAASWVELCDFIPAVLDRRRRSARGQPQHLRRRPQGDVLARLGRPAVGRLPGAARSAPGRAARAPVHRGLRGGSPGGRAVAGVGGAPGAAAGDRRRHGRVRRAPGRGRRRHPRRHAGEDHRHLDLRHRDRARERRAPRDPRHLRHRRRLGHARLPRHRGRAVGGRRSAGLVDRRRARPTA